MAIRKKLFLNLCSKIDLPLHLCLKVAIFKVSTAYLNCLIDFSMALPHKLLIWTHKLINFSRFSPNFLLFGLLVYWHNVPTDFEIPDCPNQIESKQKGKIWSNFSLKTNFKSAKIIKTAILALLWAINSSGNKSSKIYSQHFFVFLKATFMQVFK